MILLPCSRILYLKKKKYFYIFKESEKILPSVPKVKQSKLPSLFDDSDNFDLFAPKPSVIKSEPKPAEPPMPVKVSILYTIC